MAGQTKEPMSPLLRNIIAGGTAGVCEIMVMYPLDVVKTRQQLYTGPSSQALGVAGTFRNMITKEGFAVCYRGITSPLFAEAPKRAVKFAANEKYKELYGVGTDAQLYGAFALAGASAGVTEALINCPFEMIKVRLQSPAGKAMYASASDALGKIIRKEGVTALYKGIEPQMYRNAFWNGTFFSLINELKGALPEPTTKSETLARNFAAGTIASICATTTSTPWDVVKSRVQDSKGRTPMAIPTLIEIYRSEGLASIYKGYTSRILRLGPGGGIMIVAFDFINQLLADPM